MHTIISTSNKTKDLGLTTHEFEILHMLAFDYTLEEMRLELESSQEEIEILEKSLYAKMGVETKTGLMRMAYELEILILTETQTAQQRVSHPLPIGESKRCKTACQG